MFKASGVAEGHWETPKTKQQVHNVSVSRSNTRTSLCQSTREFLNQYVWHMVDHRLQTEIETKKKKQLTSWHQLNKNA